jgi:HSP20 family protein
MDRLFGDMFGDVFGPTGSMQTSEKPDGGNGGRRQLPAYHLPVNISEMKDGYRIEAPVPGFRPEEVEITFADGVLSIDAQRREEDTREDENYMRREVGYGHYRRQISLPGDVRGDDIKATFENGVLNVIVPRAPRPEPKRIQVQAGDQSKQLAGSGSGSRSESRSGSESQRRS